MVRNASKALKLAVITAAHGATDGGAVFFLPLLPLVMGELGLGALQAGVLVGLPAERRPGSSCWPSARSRTPRPRN